MKKSLILWLALGLSACQLPQTFKEAMPNPTEKKVEKPMPPAWTQNSPDDSNYLYQVVYVPETDDLEWDKGRAKDLALKELNARLFATYQASYQQAIEQEEVNQGMFERKIRQAARAQLPALVVTDVEVADVFVDSEKQRVYLRIRMVKSDLDIQLNKRLMVLDNRLREYLHISDQGGNLKQFLALIPVLPTLEERRVLKLQLETILQQEVKLPNDTLVALMDRQISKLIDHIVVNLEPSTDDSEIYELRLRQALEAEGMNMTARIPDLVLKYYIEPEPVAKEAGLNKIVMLGDIEIIDNQGRTFARVTEEQVQGLRRFESDAENEALDYLAKKTSDAIMLQMIAYMNQVNQQTFKR